MKKLSSRLSLIVLFLAFFIEAYSQGEIATAKAYLTQNAVKQRLSDADINEMSVSSAYLSPSTGWYHIYFNQNYQSVEVYNGMLNLTLQNGEVKYVANSFVPFLAGILPNASLNRSVTPVNALIKAAQFKNLTPSKSTQIQTLNSISLADGSVSKASFQDNNLSDEPVNVKLYWLPYIGLENGKSTNKIALTWNVKFLTKDGKNKWNIHVDANTGEVLKENDDIIHCDFGTPNHLKTPHICSEEIMPKLTPAQTNVVAGNSYKVFDYPLESPNHVAGNLQSIVSSPYTRFAAAGTGPGTTNGWHSDGTNSYTNTKGNNVDAKDDKANDDEGTVGSSPSSATLDFSSYTYTQSTGTALSNLDAAVVNLFYWNNIMHDVLWKYGFDEPSGNFQKNNMGRGGLGNDFVYADAQDGSGTNNANFSTPVDGGNGRMQMFIFSNNGSPTYTPDSDFDNGVMAHEYGHGWSNRLTGGPANSDCLNNAEQAGEGWSDYALLMFTTPWSSLTPSVASANIPRGVGTYVIGQDPTTGAGIRPYRYSYDKATYNNPVTYGGINNTVTFSKPHGIGSIWATILWDMTWEIILQDNYIENNIYDVPANITNYKGNIAALKLVNEGLRMQPCSPSFVQSRDAILQADAMLFGGRYHCAIAKAFARRGLGANATTGITTNDRVVTEDFTPISGPALSSSNLATTCSNQVFSYTATSNASGATFSWTRQVVAGVSNGAGSGSNANVSETLINTTTEPIIVKYLFTISPNDCPGTSTAQAVNVTVNPNITPVVAAYSVCQSASMPSGQGLVGAIATNSVNSAIIPGNYYVRGSGNNTTTYSPYQYVFYKAITFVAPSSAAVTFTTTAAALTGTYPFDTYLSLYQTSFNPNSPATNFLRGDDDSGPLQYSSKLTQTLMTGQTYILVVSTYAFFESGTFTLQATSPTAADAIGFGIDQKWFTAASGGSAIFTGRVLNPVGLAGSGIPNTSTVGSTTFYVTNPLYPTCRTPATFTISSSVGGIISSDASFCSPTNLGTLTLSGHTGTILRWESSTDNFVTPQTIANTTTTLNYANLTQTTKYRAVIQNGSCASSTSTPATITIAPLTVTAGSNSPVTAGGTINLTATTTGTTFAWAGPNTFTSTAQNPSIASATSGMAGVYTVTITSSGTCTATATTNVVINPASTVCSPPTGATAGSNSPVTVGSPINLTSSSTGGTSQAWAGPGGFTATAQNPSIASATSGMAGVYTVTIASSGTCTTTATVNVVVNPLPTGAVIFVNVANGSSTQDGNSWATAYSNLQIALSTSLANAEIWVAQGTYKPTTTLDRTISFNIPSGVMLYGGFVGTEAAQNQRNFKTNATILSGEIGAVSTVGDNSYHVVTFFGASSTTILDGFTVMAGNANLTADRSSPVAPPSQVISVSDGGGIGLDNASSPMIINCNIFSNNGINGGGLFAINESNPTVVNCIFRNNQATFGGGTYHLFSNPVYKNVLFAGNKAIGGSMYNNQSSPIISNTTMAGNGGLNGAIFNSNSSPVVKNSILWGNIAPFNDTQSIITYSIVENGYPGIGNLNLDPQFVNLTPNGLTPNLTGDYQLTNTSPAIDAGNNGAITLTDKDLVGNLRRYNSGIVDIGAYEFQGSRIGGTVISNTSGNWESGSTWNIGRSPLAGDVVIINNNHIVTINQDGVLKTIELKPNAKVIYGTPGIKLQTGF